MEYSIKQLADLAGVSTRTLRYYEESGLLSPERIESNNYRVYGSREVNRLQDILFYRALDVPLREIKEMLKKGPDDRTMLLEEHLFALKAKKKQLAVLISNLENTIAAEKGEKTMSDKDKFEGFKKQLVEDNEKRYGKEAREKFGNKTLDASNERLMNLSPEQYESAQALSEHINETLKIATQEGDPTSESAQNLCALHREWLSFYWSSYSKEAHLGLAQMYVEDSRFKKYYDDVAAGGAEFLREALQEFCK